MYPRDEESVLERGVCVSVYVLMSFGGPGGGSGCVCLYLCVWVCASSPLGISVCLGVCVWMCTCMWLVSGRVALGSESSWVRSGSQRGLEMQRESRVLPGRASLLGYMRSQGF